jgi:drug/metabolite transporter (DMT)-like permease
VLALLIISLQNIAVKWIGGDYSALEIVAVRSLVALPCTLLLYHLEGGRGLPTTRFPGLEFLRGISLFLSYTTFMMGLAALPLADIEAIRFSGPLMIALLSVAMLGEKVGLNRWLALVVGFIGVLLIVRPGSAAFNLGSIFVTISVFFYALTAILTRKLQASDSSATMSYLPPWCTWLLCWFWRRCLPWLGRCRMPHASIAFSSAPGACPAGWTCSSWLDGVAWASWTYFMARAYSLAQASVIAPLEYLSLPINIVWGLLIGRKSPA